MGAVKRFGYKSDLNYKHIKAISREISIDYAEMQSDDRSI
jgi:hypothetical protein